MKRILLILTVLLSFLVLFSCGTRPSADLKTEDIHAICELATLKCYYNEVAQIEKTKDHIFQRDRKMWIEYEGVAVLGVDMSEITVSIEGDTVKITSPKAKILSIAPTKETLNEKSYVTSSDGFLFKNKITTEDQEKGIIAGQAQMEAEINKNKGLFREAEEKAKQLIENYVKQLGDYSGKSYTVAWQ